MQKAFALLFLIFLVLVMLNYFLGEKKSFDYRINKNEHLPNWIGLRYNDKSEVSGLNSLSSGEQQIITLLYASMHIDEQNIVLIIVHDQYCRLFIHGFPLRNFRFR